MVDLVENVKSHRGDRPRVYCYRVGRELGRGRLDQFLSQAAGLSRTRSQRLIRNGEAWIAREPVIDPAYLVKPGQDIRLRIPPSEPCAIIPQAMALDIVFEDADILVINKPPGLVVHIAPGHETHTLVHALLAHCSDLSGIGGVCRPGIVHRLDKDTSGLMVVAKNDASHHRLSEQFSAHTVKRLYHGLVWGRPIPRNSTVERNIGRHPIHRQKMAVLAAKGKYAKTSYRVLSLVGDTVSYLEFSLATGRTHQIRVHMTSLGHPIVGDTLYHLKRYALPFETRQALHAISLSFCHPRTEKPLHFHASLPQDMQTLIARLSAL